MSDYQIFFHVGYPKAASSSLQLNLFPYHDEINNLSAQSELFQGKSPLNSFYYNLKHLKPTLYEQIDHSSIFYNYIFPNLEQKRINVFSEEGIITDFSKTVDQELRANRVKYYFPNAKIIIIIRQQAEFLRSFYDWGNPDKTIDKWLDKLFNQENNRLLSSLNFYKAMSLYYNLFGKDNVKVLLFEELKFNPDSFGNKLANFLGISTYNTISNLKQPVVNSYNSDLNKYRRFRANLLPNVTFSKYLPNSLIQKSKKLLIKYLSKRTLKKSSINQAHMEQIRGYYKQFRGYYKQSNQKLIDLTGLELDKYNYPL